MKNLIEAVLLLIRLTGWAVMIGLFIGLIIRTVKAVINWKGLRHD